MLTNRQKLILKAIVEEYIKTAEPVGSKLLTEKPYLNFSPATLRSEMAALEEMGYLEKTHTSSGRIPSQFGYKYYVDHLVTRDDRVVDSFPLIDKILTENQNSREEAVKKALDLLSDLTSYTAVAMGPDIMKSKLKKLDLIQLSDSEAILLIVTSTGHIENSKIEIPEHMNFKDLNEVVTTLNTVLKDKPLSMIESVIHEKFSSIQIQQYMDYQDKLVDIFLQAFQKFASDSYYFTGLSNMFDQPEFRDIDKLKDFMTVMSSRSLLKVIDEVGDSLSVQIGRENRLTQMSDCTIVSVPYRINETENGTIAVIGPTRMEYRKVIPLVEYIAKNMSKLYEK